MSFIVTLIVLSPSLTDNWTLLFSLLLPITSQGMREQQQPGARWPSSSSGDAFKTEIGTGATPVPLAAHGITSSTLSQQACSRRATHLRASTATDSSWRWHMHSGTRLGGHGWPRRPLHPSQASCSCLPPARSKVRAVAAFASGSSEPSECTSYRHT